MFIRYAINTKILDSEPLDLQCQGCQEDNLHLTIYKTYFELYWVLMIPLKRGCMLMCPHCEQTHTKQEYLRFLEAAGEDSQAIEQKLKTRFKNAKTPLYPKISMSILVLAVAVGMLVVNHYERERKAQVTNYKQNPSSNVLVVVKEESEKYPYVIYHVQKVLFDKAKVAPAKYCYKTDSDAKEAVQTLLKEQFLMSFADNFHPYRSIYSNELVESAITQVHPLRKARPQGPLAPLAFDH